MVFLGAGTRCGQDGYSEQRRKQPVHTQYVNQRQLPEQFCQQSDGRRRRQERGGHGGRPHGHVCDTPQTGTKPRLKPFKRTCCTAVHTFCALSCIFQEEQTNDEETEPNNRPTEPQSQPAQTPRPKRNREHFATIRTASVVITQFINDSLSVYLKEKNY